MIPREITLKDLKFEKQFYVTGHFDFIFKVKYDDNDSEQEIIRRYSDIRSLYKTLLLKTPGCRIPNIPSKTIWLKINYGNEKEIKERKEGILEFLNHIIEHKILRKNKYVIKFFSPKEKSFSYDKNLKIGKENLEKGDSDDEFASNIIDIQDDKKQEKDDNYLDEDDIEPLDDFVQEYNNRKKGIVSKGKNFIENMYNLVMNYANNSSKKNEEGEDDNNANENNDENSSNITSKKLTKEDYEYIRKNTKVLGEDFDINDYNEKINRLNEGVKNIIENFEKLNSTRKKSLDALKEIVIE